MAKPIHPQTSIGLGIALDPEVENVEEGSERGSPILVAADDDWEALGAMVERMPQFSVIPTRTWPQLLGAVKNFKPDLVLMADTLRSSNCNSQDLLELLYRDFKVRVLMLSEFTSPKETAKWQEHGAVGCSLHPTKVPGRMNALIEKTLELTGLGRAAETEEPGGEA